MSDDRDATRPLATPRPDPDDAATSSSATGRHREARGFGSALVLTALGAVLPGTGFLAAGRRLLGGLTLALFLLLIGVGVYLATAGRQVGARLAVDPGTLRWLGVGLGVLAVAWVLVIVAQYRMLAPRRTTRGQHLIGAFLVLLLAAGVALPAVQVFRIAGETRDVITAVFGDRASATVVDRPDPFGDQERVNVLLLGGDGGEGREGVRTDTVIVASLDTETGDTVLVSLPRNLEDLPFPEDSPLAAVYPDGFDAGSESESLLNAIYRNGPAQHPGILGATDDPGADFLKLGVGEALGLPIDYFVLVNLDGFSRLVDALGGITVNVNYWVPINGEPSRGIRPDDYIAPGPNRHMDGATALHFARGRFGLTDYDRMARQRCTIDAIVEAADPVTLLRQYQELAATTEDIVSTDIPQSALDDFVDLGFRVKDAEIRSLVFDETVIDPAYPDYDRMRRLVQEALVPPPPPPPADDTAPGPSGSPAPTPATGPAADVEDACAYDRAGAEAALAEGKPPTRNG